MHLIRRTWQVLVANWKIALPAGVLVLAGLYWLAFSFFGIQTLFTDDKVAEVGPEFDSGAGAPDGGEGDVTLDDDMPADERAEREQAVGESAAANDPMPSDAPEIVRLVEGTFVDRSHPGEGTAVVLNDGTTQRFLRLEEDFGTDNGPDLNVYLSAAPPDAAAGDFDDDFVDLGDLKGNIGSQNYEIPSDVDLDRYRTVVIWCVRFGVAFTAAALA